MKLNFGNHLDKTFNPFVPNAPFLYPLKTSENRKANQKVPVEARITT